MILDHSDLERVQTRVNAFADEMQNFGVDSLVLLVVAGTSEGHALSWAQRGNHYSCIGSAERWLGKAKAFEGEEENDGDS